MPAHSAVSDFAKSRSLSVPEVRLPAPPAQPFNPNITETKLPNIPDTTNGSGFMKKIFGKTKEGNEEKNSGMYRYFTKHRGCFMLKVFIQ